MSHRLWLIENLWLMDRSKNIFSAKEWSKANQKKKRKRSSRIATLPWGRICRCYQWWTRYQQCRYNFSSCLRKKSGTKWQSNPIFEKNPKSPKFFRRILMKKKPFYSKKKTPDEFYREMFENEKKRLREEEEKSFDDSIGKRFKRLRRENWKTVRRSGPIEFFAGLFFATKWKRI